MYPYITNYSLSKPLFWLKERTILAEKNDNVNEVGDVLLNKLPGDKVIYKSVNTVEDK